MRRLISILAIFVAVHDSIGQEREFPAHNCAITPPPNWQTVTNFLSQPGVVAVFGNRQRTRLVFVAFDNRHKPPRHLDERFISQFERESEDAGKEKRLWGRFIEVDGIKSYERLGYATLRGKRTSTLTRAVPTTTGFYIVNGMRLDGDASEANEIVECVESFRFIKPPPPVAKSRSVDSAPYRISNLIGRLTVLVLFLIVVVAIVKRVSSRKNQGA